MSVPESSSATQPVSCLAINTAYHSRTPILHAQLIIPDRKGSPTEFCCIALRTDPIFCASTYFEQATLDQWPPCSASLVAKRIAKKWGMYMCFRHQNSNYKFTYCFTTYEQCCSCVTKDVKTFLSLSVKFAFRHVTLVTSCACKVSRFASCPQLAVCISAVHKLRNCLVHNSLLYEQNQQQAGHATKHS